MAEYINRELLKQRLPDIDSGVAGAVCGVVRDIVDTIPTADVVPVVRCKDCQNFCLRRGSCGESIPTCSVWGTTVYHDGFCGRGIREKRGAIE